MWRIKGGYGSFQFGKQQHSKKTTTEQENNNIAKKQQQNKRALIFLNFFPHSNANSILNILYIVYYVLIFHYNQVYMTTPDYKALHGETNYVLLIN